MRAFYLLALVFLTFTITSFGQEGTQYKKNGSDPDDKFSTYRSANNPFYWKNRKPFEGYWQQDVHYKIVASLDDTRDMIDAEEWLTYWNNSPDTLKVLYFHLYQNAFQPGSYYENLQQNNKSKIVFGKNEKDTLCQVVEYVKIGAQKMKIEMDNTIMKIVLDEPLLPGSSLTLNIKFKSYFGYGGNLRRRMKLFIDHNLKHYDAVHWYPRICVYDRKFGWETDQHLSKEFYGDFGSFDVELNLPNNYITEATGVLQNRAEALPDELRKKLDVKNFAQKPWGSAPSEIIKPDGSTKKWIYNAINVHDFAFTTDPSYRIAETTWNNIQCIGLVQEQHAAGWQNSAELVADVLKTYSSDFGMYAYPKMVAADARDGMEYPMLTLDGGQSPSYDYVISHEVGHNWFFGMVGSNETYRAALDEGFTQFLTAWYMTKTEANKTFTYRNKYLSKYAERLNYREQYAYSAYMSDAMDKNDEPLNTHSDGFNGALGHGGGYRLVYYKTSSMLYNLQYVLGDELFQAAMQNYFNQWKICHPYFEDFRNSIIHFTKTDLNWFFDQWLETTKTIDYAVKKVKPAGAPNQYEITFKRKGRMQMPLDFTVTTSENTKHNFVIPNTYFEKKTTATTLPYWRGWDLLQPTFSATVSVPGGIKNIEIDPTQRLADVYQIDNALKCPIKFTFDHQLFNPTDYHKYRMYWRPDIWYNSFDGIKAGLNLNGNYAKRWHIFDLSVWYNTEIFNLADDSWGKNNPVSYLFSYKNRIGKFSDWYLNSRFLDGLAMNQLGFEKSIANTKYFVFFKSMYRPRKEDLNYLLYPELWKAQLWNNSLNLGVSSFKNYGWGFANTTATLRSTALGSDYQYAYLNLNRIDNFSKGKIDFRLRSVIQVGSSRNQAIESSIFFAGASPEEMMDSKYSRSAGIVPDTWVGYGADYNHYHAGGGLNLRGYSNYLVPVNQANNQYLQYRGNSGAALNAEIDFDRIIKLEPRFTKNWLHIDLYAFADAGIIGDKQVTGKFLLMDALRADAGIGSALTIKRWWYLGQVQPLTIRFDMPLFLSSTPYVSPDFVQARWVVGIGRAF